MPLKSFLILLLCVAVICLLTFLTAKSHEPKNYNEYMSELNQIKNTITKELLLNCKIEARNCEFDPEKLNVDELAKYLREAECTSALNHPEPHGSIYFTETETENYFKIRIEFCSTWEERIGVVYYIDLYKNNKRVAHEIFASPELSSWCKENFPEAFITKKRF
jgi:hypothetical protein